jgi:WD40 repeat protein
VTSVALDPDGSTLAARAADDNGDAGSVILWDLGDRRIPRRIGLPLKHAGPERSMAFSPDGAILATISGGTNPDGSYNRTVVLWDLGDRDAPRRVGGIDDAGAAYSVAFSRDGTLAVGSGETLPDGSHRGSVVLWDVGDRQAPRRIGKSLGHDEFVRAVKFSPDGAVLAASTRTRLPDGGYSGSVTLWDVNNPRAPHRIGDRIDHPDPVTALAFSPDSTTLAANNIAEWFPQQLDSLVLWDVTDRRAPRQIGDPIDYPGPAKSLAFGGTTVAVDSGGSILLWDLDALASLRADLRAQACRRAGRGLTRDEWTRYVPDLPYTEMCI